MASSPLPRPQKLSTAPADKIKLDLIERPLVDIDQLIRKRELDFNNPERNSGFDQRVFDHYLFRVENPKVAIRRLLARMPPHEQRETINELARERGLLPPAVQPPPPAPSAWKNRAEDDRKLSPPEYIAKHYASEIEAGTLTQGMVGRNDLELMKSFRNWRNYRIKHGQSVDLSFEFPVERQPRDNRYRELYGDAGDALLEAQRGVDRQRMSILRHKSGNKL